MDRGEEVGMCEVTLSQSNVVNSIEKEWGEGCGQKGKGQMILGPQWSSSIADQGLR